MRIASFEKWGEWIDARRDRRPMETNGVSEVVLATLDKCGKLETCTSRTTFGTWTAEVFGGEVVAWMPMPEPWQGETE